ncbi:MAG: 2-iminoacetate synthase ThiH [Bacteroidia bacterium]|nr:2-iminoacetate synthase ThiH [Bacteroidia bacterium]
MINKPQERQISVKETNLQCYSSFKDTLHQYNWDSIKDLIYSKKEEDVINALSKPTGKCTLDDFMAMISPAGLPFLERMATRSHQITQERFGKIIQLYIPLYLSNECQNICTYCGFSMTNKIKRIILSDDQISKEIEVIKSHGFDNVLIVTGEANKTVGIDYMLHALEIISPHFAQVSMEVQPMDTEDYQKLTEAGVYSILVYQETYNAKKYQDYHPKGRKSNFDYRLDTPDRIGKAGMHKIGLGCLIGLEDWRTDSWFTALHLNYLEKKYWQTKYSISFPRLRPAEGVIPTNNMMTDKELVQLICAYRIFDPDVELSLSTRETKKFRDNAIKLGITSISAGSKTNPGGYSVDERSLEQFEISDERDPQEFASVITNQGYEPVWKDWFGNN